MRKRKYADTTAPETSTAHNSLRLTFRKHKGQLVTQVPDLYLKWLCQWYCFIDDHGREAREDRESSGDASAWLR